jgi:peptidyl-prolyl cis-trans isomerase A (cyclophilin A)
MMRHVVAAAMAVLMMGSVQAQNVRLSTTMGDIVVQVDANRAPKTVANFLQYVRDGHYNGTIFHRVISNFMIQGGGMTPDMGEKPTRAPIPQESRNGLSNQRGTIAMARTMNPNSATAQFFINVKDNDFLDAANAQDGNGYAVFGKVVQGMDVVEKIRKVRTTQRGMHGDVPTEPIVIKQATIEK